MASLSSSGSVDLRTPPDAGVIEYPVRIPSGRHPSPALGVRVRLPRIVRACYFAPFQKYAINSTLDLWPEGYNQCHPLPVTDLRQLKRGGMFLLAELAEGGYLALLPLAHDRLMAWLRGDAEGLLLEADHFGTEAMTEELPLLAWARDPNPYRACRRAWEEAAAHPRLRESTVLRSSKELPPPFRYLGWCTFEQYKLDICEPLLLDAFSQLKASGVPVRWVLIDDGHLDDADGPIQDTQEGGNGMPDNRLASFGTNRERFPNGWTALREAQRAAGIDWLGLWINFGGYWGGIAAPDGFPPRVAAGLIEVAPGRWMPADRPEAARHFYEAWLETISAAGFDFIKADGEAKNVTFYSGRVANAVRVTRLNHAAFEEAMRSRFQGGINCMAHNNLCSFSTRFTQVTRCSEDYKKGDVWRAKHHLSNSYYNSLWLGQTVWCDHDMFHSGDPLAGGLMARSKALSGGPIYLSDAPDRIDRVEVDRLCYADGRLLMPEHPAVPAPDSLFVNTYESAAAFKAMAPLTGRAVGVIGYNLTHPERPVSGTVGIQDWLGARSYGGTAEGRTETPPAPRRLLVFRWDDRSVLLIEGKETVDFRIDRFGDALFWLIDACRDVVVLGRADKYLGPLALREVDGTEKTVRFSLAETGPVYVWAKEKKPVIAGQEAVSLPGGLWRIDLPLGPEAVHEVSLAP